MLLRAVLAGLILLNALFYCWTQGWLDDVVGIKARGDREPERLTRQIHPEQVVVLPPIDAVAAVAAAASSAPASSLSACLVLGPLDGDAALAAATQALAQAAITPKQWRDQASEQPGLMQTSWAVATIRLPNKDFQARKEATYKSMKIAYDHLAGPPDEVPTLVLSRHPSEKAAAAALEAFSQRALKGLRVLALQTPAQRHLLVFAEADTDLQAKLTKLDVLPLAASLKPCAIEPAVPTSIKSAASAASSSSSATPAPRSPAPAASASPR